MLATFDKWLRISLKDAKISKKAVDARKVFLMKEGSAEIMTNAKKSDEYVKMACTVQTL